MKIKTRCNHCGKIYQMSPDYLGKTAQCKQCQNNFVMELFEEAPEAPMLELQLTDGPAAHGQAAFNPTQNQPPARNQAMGTIPGLAAQAHPKADPMMSAMQAAPAMGNIGMPGMQPQPIPGLAMPAPQPLGVPGMPGGVPFQPMNPEGLPPAQSFGGSAATQIPPQAPFGLEAPGLVPQATAIPGFPGQPMPGQAQPLQMSGASMMPSQPSYGPAAMQTSQAPYAPPMPDVAVNQRPPSPGLGVGNPSAQLNITTQTVVCPKCRYSADIPPISSKMKVRCQQCGHRFVVKPEKKKPAAKAEKAGGGSRQVPKAAVGLLLVVLLAAAVLFVGPSLFPDLIPELF